MKKAVCLTICGKQYYPDMDPEIIELTTDGTLEYVDGGWNISYEESELTGMAGTVTTFRLEPGQVILSREGGLRSQMVFREGIPHESLYRMEFGTLLLSVCAKSMEANISENGGTIDLVYDISIEHGPSGLVEYHLDIRV